MLSHPGAHGLSRRAATNQIFLVRDLFPGSVVSEVAVMSAAIKVRVRMAISQAAYPTGYNPPRLVLLKRSR